MHPSRDICRTKSSKLKGKRIVLGVTGSIAAVETVRLVRELIRHGAEVHPVATKAAQRIIHPDALTFASGQNVITEIDGWVQHVDLCGEVEDKADLLLIAPCTANTVSKIAYGIDDTTVTTFATTALGTGIPLMIAPAMHGSMYNHKIVLENIEKLKSIGVEFIDPKLEDKKAKMAAVEEVVVRVIRKLWKGDLSGKKVLVIAGSTAESVDDVRLWTNRSSGKTGLAFAEVSYERGGEVELWMGRCSVGIPSWLNSIGFESTKELLEMVENSELDFDVIVMPAAVSDYAPEWAKGKIPSGKEKLLVELKPNPKVIDRIVKKAKDRKCLVIGFKAESGLGKDELVGKAKEALERAGADFIAANDISAAEKDFSTIYLVDRNKNVKDISGSKEEVAEKVLDEIGKAVSK